MFLYYYCFPSNSEPFLHFKFAWLVLWMKEKYYRIAVSAFSPWDKICRMLCELRSINVCLFMFPWDKIGKIQEISHQNIIKEFSCKTIQVVTLQAAIFRLLYITKILPHQTFREKILYNNSYKTSQNITLRYKASVRKIQKLNKIVWFSLSFIRLKNYLHWELKWWTSHCFYFYIIMYFL